MQTYDVALIGSGPAGYAALMAMQGDIGSVAVITGATDRPSYGGSAKIISVAYERRKPACLTERTEVSGGGPPLFSAAEVGGLANYWGKQLQVYDREDPWGQGRYIENWHSYRLACNKVQAELDVIGGLRRQILGNGLEKSAPRLLTGTADAPGTGLGAMSKAVEQRLAEMPNADVHANRVVYLETDQDAVCLFLEGGAKLRARKVFLAAGVLGTASLLSRSASGIDQIGFRDHAPYTINCLRLSRALGPPRSYANRGNFNALTLKRTINDRCNLFASVYAVSQAPASLLTAMLGLGAHFRGWRIGRLIDFVQPVRLWTPRTLVQLRYLPRQNRIEPVNTPDPAQDEGLCFLQDWFASHQVLSQVGVTQPGQGFHYHKLTIGARNQPVDQMVDKAYQGRVCVVDASCLSEIGCQPHTLTSMAQAYGRVRHILSKTEAVQQAI